MGDVLSTHLDDARRQHIAEKTEKILTEFLRFYEDQYGVSLFNSMPHNYGLVLYENKVAYERQIPPRAVINSAGYKVLTSVDQYLELVGNSLPGTTSKSGSTPILKCPTQFPLILWHPYARHYYFCMMTEAEQDKWQAVLQDCVRHCNNGIPENSKVEGPAFTDAIRMYRQSKEQYGTWEMLCGNEVQILSNLVMEELGPALKAELGPRLKGKPPRPPGRGPSQSCVPCSVDLLPRRRPQTHRMWPVLRDTQSPALTPSTDFFPCSLVPWGFPPSFQIWYEESMQTV